MTVLLKKEEHKEGSAASQGMLDAIDSAPPGSVYVMVVEQGLDYAGIGALMATAMKVRGMTGAIVDGSVRDTPQIGRLQFPVYSRGIAPSTTINHFRFAGVNVPVTCAGVRVNGGDMIVADEDGVAVVPRAQAADVLKKSPRIWIRRSTRCCRLSKSSVRSRKRSRSSGEFEGGSKMEFRISRRKMMQGVVRPRPSRRQSKSRTPPRSASGRFWKVPTRRSSA